MKKGGGNVEGQCCEKLYTNLFHLFLKGGRDFTTKSINNRFALKQTESRSISFRNIVLNYTKGR